MLGLDIIQKGKVKDLEKNAYGQENKKKEEDKIHIQIFSATVTTSEHLVYTITGQNQDVVSAISSYPRPTRMWVDNVLRPGTKVSYLPIGPERPGVTCKYRDSEGNL